MSNLNKRYDFVFLFDVKDGNPNGDPDAGNLPRIDAETGMGLVTDVCLKRKVRNYVLLNKEGKSPYDIYVKEKAVLGRAHNVAFADLGIALGEEGRREVPEGLTQAIEDFPLPEGLSLDEEDEKLFLVVAADADVKSAKQALKEAKPEGGLKKFFDEALKGVKSRKPTAEETGKGRDWMCSHFYDIRTFGAVMSLKSAPNCGQVRGPIQMTFARSVDPIVVLEHSITRMAVATEAEAEKQGGDNRTMGRKFTVPYGLYRSHGFVSAHLANQTGFSEEDLKLFWDALVNGFEHDRSAARGEMSTRPLLAFEHATALGNAPAHSLFERVQVKRREGSNAPARAFEDYEVLFDGKPLPPVDSVKELEKGIKLIRLA
jgi:CRISPR-associated protein Csd2